MCYFEVLEGRRHVEALGDDQNAGTVRVVLAFINAGPRGWGLAFLTSSSSEESARGQTLGLVLGGSRFHMCL